MAKRKRRVRSVNNSSSGIFHEDTKNMLALMAILFLLGTIFVSMLVVWYRVGAPASAVGF